MGAAELEAPLPAADRIVPGPYRVCFLRKSFIAVPVFRLKRAQRPDGALKPICSAISDTEMSVSRRRRFVSLTILSWIASKTVSPVSRLKFLER